MNARFQDLNFYELDDGSIRLEQIGYAGEVAVIDAHPEQLLYIARRLCGIKPETANQVADLQRRIAVLTDKLQTLVCNSAFRSDLLEGTETGFEYIAKLDGLLDLALEFDGGRLEPEGAPAAAYGASNPDGAKMIDPPKQMTGAQKTQSKGIHEGSEQLGLAV